jgi:hypothetical protein
MRELFGDRVAYISVLDTVCSDTGCPMMAGNEPVYWDTVHLTGAGSTLFAKKLAPKLLDILHAGTVPAVSDAAPGRLPDPG